MLLLFLMVYLRRMLLISIVICACVVVGVRDIVAVASVVAAGDVYVCIVADNTWNGVGTCVVM